MTALALHDVTVALAGRPIVRGIDLALDPGEIVALLGPNGAGKSTLMRAMAGLLPHGGAIDTPAGPLAQLGHRGRARVIAYLPQERVVHWPLSVEKLVLLGRLPYLGLAGKPGGADRDAAIEAMRSMQVDHLADRPCNRISGGELARALAARAIAQDTPFLIADEPAAGLDPAHQIRLMSAFRAIAAAGRMVFVSMHDIELAARWADRLVLIKDGAVVADGAPADALSEAVLRDVYGIAAHIGSDAGGMTLTPLGLAGEEAP